MAQRNYPGTSRIGSEPVRPYLRLCGTEPQPDQTDARAGPDHRIAIVDDNHAARSTMASLLEHEGYRVLAFASGEDFLNASLSAQVSCVVLDILMPGISGLDVLRVLNKRGNRPSVLVLSGYGGIPVAVEAMRLGAFDYLEKPYMPDALLVAVEQASQFYLRSRANLDCDRDAPALVAGLSVRQRQVLAGIVKGQPNKLIAYDLGLSIRTVESYRAHVLARLGVHSTAEAVRIAIAAGTLGIAFNWSGPGTGPDAMIQARPIERASAVESAGETPVRPHRPRWEATLAE